MFGRWVHRIQGDRAVNSFARTAIAASSCLGLTAFADAACAQDADSFDGSEIEISANAAIVSDYRFRGISLSDRDPAIQGGFDIAHEIGFFVGTWASSIAENAGADTELDLYGGYGGELGPVNYSVQFLGYIYPGANGLDYYEISASVDGDIGPASVELKAAYIPSQSNFQTDNIYTAVAVETQLPSTPLTLHLRAGHESNTALKKWDWEAGVAYSIGPVTASLSYTDSDFGGPAEAGRNGSAGVVVALSASI